MTDANSMVMDKVIEGDVFIVPNGLVRPSNVWSSDHRRQYEVMNKRLGVPVDEKLVELWYTDGGDAEDRCQNWVDHGKREVLGILPNRMPVALFEGKKEGDVVDIPLENGVTVRLTLAQRQYRYRRFGTFEETLEMLQSR